MHVYIYIYIYIIMYIYCICMYSPIKPIHQMYTIHCFSLVKTTKNRRFFPDPAAHREPSARRRIVNTEPGTIAVAE